MDPIDEADARRRIAAGADDARPCIDGPMSWRKACRVCAFRADDPQRIGPDHQQALKDRIVSGDLVFYCLHRETPCGSHRICATASALTAAHRPPADDKRPNPSTPL